MRTRYGFRLFALGLALLATPLPVIASGGGGGGGGMGSSPSGSAPAYDPAAEYQKGLAALNAKRFAEARRAFDNVQSVVPTDVNSAYLAGVAAEGMDKPKDARRYYERALRLDRNRVDIHRALALTLVRLADAEKAQKELDALKALAEKCAGTCADAAALDDAVKAVTAAMAGTPQVGLAAPLPQGGAAGDIVYAEAVTLINRHRYDDALRALGRASLSFGPHPDVLTYIGYTNRKMGQLDRAETYYRQALAIAPWHRGALEYYGELKVERGDIAGARANLALLQRQCSFGCYETEELARWIAAGRDPGT